LVCTGHIADNEDLGKGDLTEASDLLVGAGIEGVFAAACNLIMAG